MARYVERMLGQATPEDTNAASIYSPGTNVTAIIKNIIVCNTHTADHTFRIFHDDDGTTYGDATALFYDVNCPTAQSVQIDCFIAMHDSGGNLAVRTDSADNLTFTVYGVEIISNRKLS